jgi:hypothetical protein
MSDDSEYFQSLDIDKSMEEIDELIDRFAIYDYISEDGRRWSFSGSEVGFGGPNIFFYHHDPDGNVDRDDERRFTIDRDGFVEELFMTTFGVGETVWKDTPEGAEFWRKFDEDARLHSN